MNEQKSPTQSARLSSRLMAMTYDGLIVFFLIVATITVLQLLIGRGEILPQEGILNLFLKSLWFVLSFLYFAYYWTGRGQTPGMRVWKVHAVNLDQQPMSWLQALVRYLTALFGLGLIWMLVDPQRLALQDRLSRTRLYQD